MWNNLLVLNHSAVDCVRVQNVVCCSYDQVCVRFVDKLFSNERRFAHTRCHDMDNVMKLRVKS